MLRIIERATRQPIEAMSLPTLEDVNARRATRFKEEITAVIESQAGDSYRAVLEDFLRESDADLLDVAAALASMAKGGKSLAVTRRKAGDPDASSARPEGRAPGDEDSPRRGGSRQRRSDAPQATYRLEVGRRHGALPGNIVGALAHEGDLHGSEINGLSIRDDHTLVRLPAELSEPILEKLRKVLVRGQPLSISRYKGRKSGDDAG
jgi:ATP-dependent RNA helicase DeaD